MVGIELNKVIHAKFDTGSGLPDKCIDAIPCDPPYGLKFMGKKWDYEIPSVDVWRECYRVLKPGGHMLVACGTRTQHRMAVNIEDAGFDIRDVICWHYGSGFPKSLDISKAIDKASGSERQITGTMKNSIPHCQGSGWGNEGVDNFRDKMKGAQMMNITIPCSEAAKYWDGWGTALKPATEFWTLARKPLEENTIAGNVLKHGTGGLNIDACRIDGHGYTQEQWAKKGLSRSSKNVYGNHEGGITDLPDGRFPANVIFDPFMGAELDKQTGVLTSGKPSGKVNTTKNKNAYHAYAPGQNVTGYGDSGGASRFFYCPKPDAVERGEYNNHPTVKPLALMQYLIKLICPLESGRIVLDPFAGSGTTLIAARQLGLDFIAYEMEAAHIPIIEQRLKDHLGMFL